MSWATLAQVKEHLGIVDSTNDAFLTNLIPRAQAICEAYLGRKIESATYTEYYDGNDTSELMLRQWPIISVASIHDDLDRVFADASLIAAADYLLYKERGLIRLTDSEGVFQRGQQNVKIVYTAGYATVPYDLVDALIQMVEVMFNRARTGGMVSQSLGGKSETYDTDQIPAQVKRTLARYRQFLFHGDCTA